MKIALLADIHLGHHEEFNVQNSRITNIHSAVIDCLNNAKENGASFVIFAGDFFDNGKSTDPLTLHLAYDIIKYCAETFKYTWFICGNHDMSKRFGMTIISTLCRSHKNTFCVDSGSSERVDNLKTAAFDRIVLSSWDANPIEHVDRYKRTLFVGHLPVSGAMHMNQVMYGIDKDVLSSNYARSLLGHFHQRQELAGNVHYIGTPIQHSFGEVGNETGYVMIDANNDTWKYVDPYSNSPDTRMPRFHKVSAENFGTLVLDNNGDCIPEVDYFWVVCANDTERQIFYDTLQRSNAALRLHVASRIRVTVEQRSVRVVKNEAVGGERASLVHKMGKYLQKEVAGKYPMKFRKAAYVQYREDNNG